MQSENLKTRLEKGTLEMVDLYRGIILDTVEQEVGTSSNWQFIRTRLLKALGDRGLAGRLCELIAIELEKGGI
ncbi:MAG: hypothetical protein ACXVCY_12850 [Pseudobdellovibrionaceae bacterium]